MRVALVYPPFGDPRAPQLALPSLAAFLRAAGISVTLHDLNLEGIEDLASPESLDRAIRTLHAKSRTSDLAWRALVLAERARNEGAGAFAVLRGAAFYDASLFTQARNTIGDVLFACSQASGVVSCDLTPIIYEVPAVNPAKFSDLLKMLPSHDLFFDTGSRLIAGFADDRPDIIGITITNFQQIIPGLSLARRLKHAGHFVVLGGALYTKFADTLPKLEAFFATFADAVIVYEGETALLALVEARRAGRSIASVPNLIGIENGRICVGPTHVEDVPKLPTPDFHGLPLDRYLSPEPVLPILTGKGCYFNRCKFCDIPFINHVSKKAYRVRPPEQVVEDVHCLHARHGARAFAITDEALSPRLLTQLADEFDRRPGPFVFSGYGRLEPGFDAKTCERVAGFGMKKLYFGLESASQTVIDHMDKGVRMENVPGVLANCRAAGIDFHLFTMFGLPEETEAQARETFQFLLDHSAVIDTPGSSFDLHPFGLEMRTPYFEHRADFGIELAPHALDGEFIVGFAADEWSNTHGLAAPRADELVNGEFKPALRQRFAQWHAGPDPIWPLHGEYAVLYALAFQGKRFPWRTALPEDSGQTFQFVFPPGIAQLGDDSEAARLVTRRHVLDLPAELIAMLSRQDVKTWGNHLHGWPGVSEADARGYVEALIAMGLVQIRLGPTPQAMASESLRAEMSA